MDFFSGCPDVKGSGKKLKIPPTCPYPNKLLPPAPRLLPPSIVCPPHLRMCTTALPCPPHPAQRAASPRPPLSSFARTAGFKPAVGLNREPIQADCQSRTPAEECPQHRNLFLPSKLDKFPLQLCRLCAVQTLHHRPDCTLLEVCQHLFFFKVFQGSLFRACSSLRLDPAKKQKQKTNELFCPAKLGVFCRF